MPREYPRKLRIGELLQRELAELILREVKDPRVQRVTVTAVDVAPDLSHARALISVLGAEAPQPEVVQALNHAAGFLRHELGRRLKLRSIPELRFSYDETLDRAARLEALIARANAPAQGDDKPS
ncbi:MAG: 30S ribosome-binding factor RbfA [Gammaproteobacteria bacterium]|nr:30S ribosome-binding factor RbfA [Gammaproteobacteria bacterium]MBU6508649.1 30S ribosome-binding factor RbfA [Gammaproteobacteria bacterium]MDE1982996.1 30S ribosome-binding factor RbfA [Gammaproteobacteria bacterium]MDE2107745.1 30S ribosome-binding factor RbfA [Gammaproteobacteria bacterium]MDE2461587.1 30S ribosome-binding factor RbfA [Gammaproteobacteria bacterium]